VGGPLRRMWQSLIYDCFMRPIAQTPCLRYVDIFYFHRFDPDTPLEETMGALDYIVRSGRVLYIGISSYNSERSREAVAILKDLSTPCPIHQPSYNMLNRWI
jgi:L-glyceraldehyde 3-phosphate reductase